MADDQLRALERRFRETDAVEDGAAWLLAGLRAGARTVEQLRLAAYLGYAAARRALGADAPPTFSPSAAYQTVPSGEDWLLIGLAEPFAQTLTHLSESYLAELWTRCAETINSAGLDPKAFAYGGMTYTLYPEPDLDPAPTEGFGWVAPLDPGRDAVQRLNAALEAPGAPQLYAAVGTRRAFRSREPFSHLAGAYALLEWCLDDRSDWPPAADLPPAETCAPLGQFLLETAADPGWWALRSSPFAGELRVLANRAMAWALTSA